MSLPPRRVLMEFLRFGTVGAIGFVADTATIYAARASMGLYLAGAVAFFVAVTVTWIGNRLWTFRGRSGGPAHRQWLRFIAANTVGFFINRGTYAILITVSPVCAAYPVLAVAAGVAAGMFLNFHFSRTLVFR